jgi:predicted DNA-binding transcriptional regulator AlpA
MKRQRKTRDGAAKLDVVAIAAEPKLDRRAAAKRAGIGVKTMERKVEAGLFPPPGYLGRFPFWLQSAVDLWVAEQMAPCALFREVK